MGDFETGGPVVVQEAGEKGKEGKTWGSRYCARPLGTVDRKKIKNG